MLAKELRKEGRTINVLGGPTRVKARKTETPKAFTNSSLGLPQPQVHLPHAKPTPKALAKTIGDLFQRCGSLTVSISWGCSNPRLQVANAFGVSAINPA